MNQWRIDDFAKALTSLSDNTVTSYVSDLRMFETWCARSDLIDPARVTRTNIRRYLAHLTTRKFARRTIARKIAAVRRYFKWAVPTMLRTSIPLVVFRSQLAAVDFRVFSTDAKSPDFWKLALMTTNQNGDGVATTPCSKCSTDRDCVSVSCVAFKCRQSH